MHELLTDVREALTIWLGLVALTALVCAVISLTSQRGRERRAARRAARARRAAVRRARAAADPAQRAEVTPAGVAARRGRGSLPAAVAATAGDSSGDSPDELRRYAEEVAVAAGRAAVTAQRRRQEWHAVLNAQDAAWRAYENADKAARRAMKAAVYPVPDTELNTEEAQQRERYLLRAATSAYHRGELTIEQLSAAMMHREGWDPKLHPFQQDLIIRRTGRARLLRTYQSVSDIERIAWQQAEISAAAQRSLNAEAFDAAMRAHRARHPLPDKSQPATVPVAVSVAPAPARRPAVGRARVPAQLRHGVSGS
ncbi:hypothetical protein GCM10023322_04220 [Rugosimonospora acidiphila]|uniref:Uncharacterized protein n=1 Tax=Rugosimonospora acidiphila TaxID=556531 RepID=A0ABP9RJS3_9ACTN